MRVTFPRRREGTLDGALGIPFVGLLALVRRQRASLAVREFRLLKVRSCRRDGTRRV